MAESLPSEAISNLLTLSKLAVRLIDVLDALQYESDPVYEANRNFAPEIVLRTDRWGSRRN